MCCYRVICIYGYHGLYFEEGCYMIINEGDMFLYARCFVVVKGEEFYNNIRVELIINYER